MKDFGMHKWSRALEDSMPSESDLSPMIELDNNQAFPKALGSGTFRDKLMQKVNLTKNAGTNVNSLNVEYEDFNYDEDVVISRGVHGPSIQFSDRATSHLCEPCKNALIIRLLGRSHAYNYLHACLQHKWSLK